ncbi:SH3 domain-containing protein [Roseovarius sp. S4756]|uniref:SH3 domain-containing protein n=1 Tax=Roseovarius maritimus TaxID=3342637 RepID=UPI00372C915D
MYFVSNVVRDAAADRSSLGSLFYHVIDAQHDIALNGTSSRCFDTPALARTHHAQPIKRYRKNFENVVVQGRDLGPRLIDRSSARSPARSLVEEVFPMLTVSRHLMAFAMLLLPSSGALAQMDGHGPDAWQVTGVAADDVLNARTGPGADYLVIGAFAPDATGLQMVTCVPFLTRQKYWELTDSQRSDLPSRWCLMQSADLRTQGWVAARFLAEDTSAAYQPAADPLITEAVSLVRHVYDLHQSAESQSAIGPLHHSVARKYFFPDAVLRLKRGDLGADPLFDAQDTEITELEVFPAPQHAMHRGMITVHASFRNFGHPDRTVFRLRIDTSLANPALRIMRIEHDGWEFP